MPWEIEWTEWAIHHIARHGVEQHEVDEAVGVRRLVVVRLRDDRRMLYSRSVAGRYLAIVVEGNDLRTARDMTDSERRLYRRRMR